MTKQENSIDFFPFLNPVGYWKSNLKELDLEHWTNIAYEYVKDYPESANRSNIGGYQSTSNLHLSPPFFPLVEILLEKIKLITKSPNNKIEEMWLNFSPHGTFNHIHTHGCYEKQSLAGTLYLQTPSNCGRLCFVSPIDSNFIFPLDVMYKDLIIFPNYFPHFVEPNLSQEDRISISFNYEQ